MHMTQTVHTQSTHSSHVCESGTPLRPKCQIIILYYMWPIPAIHLPAMQMVMGACQFPPACFELHSDL